MDFVSHVFISNRIYRITDQIDISDDFSFQLVPHTTISECEIECQTMKTIRFNFSFSVFGLAEDEMQHSRDGERSKDVDPLKSDRIVVYFKLYDCNDDITLVS